MHDFMVPGKHLDEDVAWKMGDDKQLRRWQRGGFLDERTLKWGEWPDAATLKQILWLSLDPADKTIVDLPKGIERLERLEYLECPYWFVKTIEPGLLPASIQILHLTGSGSATCPRKLVLSGIDFLRSPECALKFLPQNFPGLTRIILKLDARGQMLDKLAEYESLQGVHLSNVSMPDLFSQLAGLSLRYVGVYIGEFANLSGIGQLTELTDLLLKKLPSLKTLDHLEEAKGLQALTVSYCSALRDASALRALSNLRQLRVHDCPKLDLHEVEAIAKKLGIRDPFIA